MNDIELKFDKGDVVVFKKDDEFHLGLITAVNIDRSAGVSIWYSIAVNKTTTYSHINGGEIPEWDIIRKILDPDIRKIVTEFVTIKN